MTEEEKGTNPHFNVKNNGEYVGAAWLNTGKFGEYITLVLEKAIEPKEKIFISPRKGQEGILVKK